MRYRASSVEMWWIPKTAHLESLCPLEKSIFKSIVTGVKLVGEFCFRTSSRELLRSGRGALSQKPAFVWALPKIIYPRSPVQSTIFANVHLTSCDSLQLPGRSSLLQISNINAIRIGPRSSQHISVILGVDPRVLRIRRGWGNPGAKILTTSRRSARTVKG